ncbi:MAG: thiamine biosynthesis protein ThiJ [Sulfurovum sp. FS08-3]|nr:MAG: thiamine biosynthesis protein ThiJ [Sulfurovum sp. FS08-3]
MATKVLIPLAQGFEEIEAVSLIDVLRRGGVEVGVHYVGESVLVTGANGISIKADVSIDEAHSDDFDMIVLPGGWGGTNILATHEKVQSLLKEFKSKDKYVAAMCAAPFALHQAGVLGERFTCYPSVEEQIGRQGYDATQKVVQDGKVITSQGPGTAICFGLALVKILQGDETYQMLVGGLLAKYCES